MFRAFVHSYVKSTECICVKLSKITSLGVSREYKRFIEAESYFS
jgi:hypothetical protein